MVFLWKKHTQNKFANDIALNKITPDRSFFKSWFKLIILLLAIKLMKLNLKISKILKPTCLLKKVICISLEYRHLKKCIR